MNITTGDNCGQIAVTPPTRVPTLASRLPTKPNTTANSWLRSPVTPVGRPRLPIHDLTVDNGVLHTAMAKENKNKILQKFIVKVIL